MNETKETINDDFLADDSHLGDSVDPVCAGTWAPGDSGEDPSGTRPDVEDFGKYWSRVAMILGFNELSKTVNTVGEKSFFRYMRDNIQADWEKEGGQKNFITYDDDIVVEIVAPHPPHIRFYERDIEMMRDAVYKYDTEKRSK